MIPEIEKIPLPMRVIGNLAMYIQGAGGKSELAQAITLMRESDPKAAAFFEQFVREMRVGGAL